MPSRLCRCGCGLYTRGGRFRPGHDAILKGQLLRAARGLDNSRYSQAEAIEQLRQLNWLHFLYGTTARVSRVVRAITGRTFGVEIECLGNRHRIVTALDAAGITTRAERYGHETRSYWKVVTDASVPSGCEIVSPILSGPEGMDELRRVCEVLKNERIRVNRSCGLHVHHGCADLDLDTLKNVVAIYNDNQDLIDGVLAPSRRNNSYCYRWSDYEKESVARCVDRSILYNCQRDRYKALNLHSFPRYGTVEFRQHQGTIEFRKMRAWILFGQSIIEQAIAGNTSSNPFEQLQDSELQRYFEMRRAAFANR